MNPTDLSNFFSSLFGGNNAANQNGNPMNGQFNWNQFSGNVAGDDTLGNFITGIESNKANLAGGNQMGGGFGLNGQTFMGGMDALKTIGGLVGAFNQNKLANAQFDFSKQMATTNLNNQIKSYNTSLTDRANNRAFVEGRDKTWADSYINDNKLVK